MSQRRTRLASVALAAAALTACSSAPAPVSLSGPQAGNTGATTPGTSTTADPLGNQPVPGADGSGTGTPGGTGGLGTTGITGPGGSTSGGTSGTSGTSGSATGGGPGSVDPPGTVTKLFTAAEDRIGITSTLITMCAHAALTYGTAFNTTADDFNVFWSARNDAGGVFGRSVKVTYENDNYTGPDAKTAATTCHAKNPFMLLGGIGFDQIPTVRNYVESVHQLYLHHTATIQGTAGQKYSFSELPTVERMGESYAQLAYERFRTKKIGIIERNSPNWSPGTDAFKRAAKRLGLTIVVDDKVELNQGNYTQQILDMKNAGAEVVFGWENALSATEIIKQAKSQLYSPQWLVFGVNLMSQTLGDDALTPPLIGAVMYTPYSYQDYSGPFAAYADDMKLFEAQYKKYRPNTDLTGVGGDLLFLNWSAQKALYEQLKLCGKDCTRNKFVDVLRGYSARPTSSACAVDFRHSDGYHGANQINFIEAYKARSGKVNFKVLKPCVGP